MKVVSYNYTYIKQLSDCERVQLIRQITALDIGLLLPINSAVTTDIIALCMLVTCRTDDDITRWTDDYHYMATCSRMKVTQLLIRFKKEQQLIQNHQPIPERLSGDITFNEGTDLLPTLLL
jgi:hypothetical protein